MVLIYSMKYICSACDTKWSVMAATRLGIICVLILEDKKSTKGELMYTVYSM